MQMLPSQPINGTAHALEEGVEQQDDVGLDGDRVEEHGHRLRVDRVGRQRGLDHDERVVDVLGVEDVTVEGRLVGR